MPRRVTLTVAQFGALNHALAVAESEFTKALEALKAEEAPNSLVDQFICYQENTQALVELMDDALDVTVILGED